MKKAELSSTKGQIYWIDYILSFFLFLIMLSIFLIVVDKFNSQDDIIATEMQKEANFIAKTLLQEGSPILWKAQNFLRTGLKEDNHVSKQRIYEFERLGYDGQKNALRMKYDFGIAFTNGSGAADNLGGICTLGSNLTSLALNNLAYYYKDSQTAFLKNNVTEILHGDIFNLSSQSDFFERINNFTLIVLDNPNFESGGGHTYNEKKQMIEDFASRGNNIILSGFAGGNMLGVEFEAKNGKNITVISKNPGLDINEEANLSMEYNYLLNCTCTQIGTDETGLSGIATWKFGNGTVFYFSNFTFFGSGNMKDEVIKTIRYNIIGKCSSMNFNDAGEEILVKIERLCLIENKVRTMGVYSWK